MPKYARKTPSTRLPELIKTGKIKGNSEHLLTNGNSTFVAARISRFEVTGAAASGY
jgi:hypothetical protein